MTVICFLVNSHFTFIYNCAKLSYRSVTIDTNNDNINFDLKGFVISLIISNFYCLNHWKLPHCLPCNHLTIKSEMLKP